MHDITDTDAPDTTQTDAPPGMPEQPVPAELVAELDAAQAQDSLRAAVATAFRHLTITRRARQHPDPFAMTLDHFAGCTRQAAYRLARVKPSDPANATSGQRRHRNLDLAVRAELLPALSHVLDAVHDMPVTLRAGGLEISGTAHLYWPRIALMAALATTTEPVSGTGLRPTARYRLHLAALAMAAVQSRIPVAWLAWLGVHRGSGDDAVVIEALTDEIEARVEERATALALASANPETAPREESGPATSVTCARCPWASTCWDSPAVKS